MRTVPLILFLLAGLATAQAPGSVEEQARHVLDQALKDKNPDTRQQAAIALSLGDGRGLFLDELESLLADKDVQVRLAAVASLGERNTRSTRAALHRALNDDVPEVSFAAAKALWNFHDPEGKEALLAVLMKESKAGSGFLTQQKRDALRMMHTPKATFLFALKQGAGFVPLPGFGEGIASMQGLLSDPNVSGRATAALLLGRDKDPRVRAALLEALSDKDWSVRAAAVHSLALENDPALENDLSPLLTDGKQAVRLRAAAACLRLDSVRGGPARAGKSTARR